MIVSGLADVRPLRIGLGEGDSAWAVLVAWDASDRAAAVDAVMTGSIEAMTRAALRVVRGWEGVVDEHGRAVSMTLEADGRRVDLRDRLLGRLTLREQSDAVAAILSAMGVIADGAVVGAGVDVRPTPPPAATGRSSS